MGSESWMGVLFVLPLHMMSRAAGPTYQAGRWERRPSSGWGGGSETVNLSGRSDTSNQCWQSVRCHTSRLYPAPSRDSLSSSPPPFTSRWIFSHSQTLKTLLTATARASKWGKCVRHVCDVVFRAGGYAGQTTLVSQCEQTAKKRIMHSDVGGGSRGTAALKLGGPHWWIILSYEVIVNLSTNASMSLGNTTPFCGCHSCL